MKLLALEFSTSRRSVALLEIVSSELHELCQIEETDFRKVTSAALIEKIFRETNSKPGEIGRIAVGLGPGSYTGIRTAIAFAQGWQLANNCDVCGISSAEVLGMEAWEKWRQGNVTIAIDAQRQELYCVAYQLQKIGPVAIDSLQITPAANLQHGGGIIAGPDIQTLVPGATPLFPHARTLARLAKSHSPTPAEKLTPIYLREASFVKAPPARKFTGESA
jgi:tRNA threonylcarbamoyl adenosine modification protein YeaZ